MTYILINSLGLFYHRHIDNNYIHFFVFFNIPSSSIVILKSNVSNWMW